MSVSNLHSLLHGKWFIHEQYGQALLPSLFPILEGKSIEVITEAQRPEYHFVANRKAGMVSGSSYNSSDAKQDYVAVISLKDPIYKYDQECGPRGTKTKMERMASYGADPFCKGVVLDIDSGGGQVSGTPEFHDFIKNFSKPVVAYTDGCMCSAAYYIGAASSYIVANKRADAIGSIGVMIYFVDTAGMWEKKGAKIITEYATQSTEKNRAFEELLDGKPELYIKTELDPIAEEFIGDIKSVRADISEDVFAGGTWNASESLAKNLIDEIGTIQTAVDKVFELSGESSSNKNNSKSNSKKKSMGKKTKKFSAIQGILGIEGDGIATISTITGNSGVRISEAQLEVLENAIVGKDASLAKAQGQFAKVKTSVNAAIKSAGMEKEAEAVATTSGKVALLGSKVVALGNKTPGTKAKTPKAETETAESAGDALVNEKDAHNEIYNNL